LRKELEILIKLQAIDVELYRTERFHREYPEKVKKLEKVIEEEKGKFNQVKERLEKLQKERRQKEKDLEAEAERVKKADEKLSSSKTNKEYQAALKEIEAVKKMNSEREDEILLLMEEIDALQAELKKREGEINNRLKEFGEEERKLKEENQEYELVSEKKKMLREELVRSLELNLLRQYLMIKEKRNGLAVVPVINGTCSGCSMNIPPQVFNEVLTNENIISCPNCSRILYVEKKNGTVDILQSKVDIINTSRA